MNIKASYIQLLFFQNSDHATLLKNLVFSAWKKWSEFWQEKQLKSVHLSDKNLIDGGLIRNLAWHFFPSKHTEKSKRFSIEN